MTQPTNRLLYLVWFLLDQVWQFMKLNFPGTDISIGALIVMPTVVGFAVRFLRNIIGVGGVGGSIKSIETIKENKNG